MSGTPRARSGRNRRRRPPPTPKSLWEPAWRTEADGPPVRFVSAARAAPLVVSCASVDDETSVKEWFAASSRAAGLTMVRVHLQGAQQVLVKGKVGPQLVQADVTSLGTHPPRCVTKSPGSGDDSPTEGKEGEVARCRLTLVSAYASSELWTRVSKSPASLVAASLPTKARAGVLRSGKVQAYPQEITCLITTKKEWVDAAMAMAARQELPRGVFLAPHKAPGDTPPTWVRREGASLEAYFDLVRASAVAGQKAMAYRPGGGNDLGLWGARPANLDGVQAPRWCLSNVPPAWTLQEVEEWVAARGGTQVAAVARRSGREATFRAWPPAEAGWETGCVFKSGLVVAPATAGKRKKPPAPKASAPGRWGVLPGEPLEAAPTEGAASEPPWAPFFDEVECGGAGDCLFCSVGWGLCVLTSGRDPAPAMVAPGTQGVAALRKAAADEVRVKPGNHGVFKLDAEVVAAQLQKMGEYAGTVALRALAFNCNRELRVWRHGPARASDQGPPGWHLAVFRPRRAQT